MMAMVSPAREAMGESISTLEFASRAKHIRNKPVVKDELDHKALLLKCAVGGCPRRAACADARDASLTTAG